MADEIFHEVRIKGAPAAVYAAITEPDKIEQWWLHATPGENDGGRTLKFGPGAGFQEMLLTDLRQDEAVRWKATENGMADWVGTELEFRLIPKEDQTFIHFKHSKWRENTPLYPHYSLSWAVFLLSLRDFVETGKGSPYPNHWIRD